MGRAVNAGSVGEKRKWKWNLSDFVLFSYSYGFMDVEAIDMAGVVERKDVRNRKIRIWRLLFICRGREKDF